MTDTVSRIAAPNSGPGSARSNQWNEYDYLLTAERAYQGEAAGSIAYAMAWLRAKALVARTPDQTSEAAIFATWTGHRVAVKDAQTSYANERLQSAFKGDEAQVRPQFLIGQYELGVFAAMRAEVPVRELVGFADETVGIDLRGEENGIMAPFAGGRSGAARFRTPL